jgi:Xaa-Pro dipeptidase
MNPLSQERLEAFVKEQGLEAVLLTNPANVTWLTGYAAPVETGPSPFEGGPALAWIAGGQVTLVLSDMESPAARACGVEAVDYVAYTIDAPIAGYGNQAEALAKALAAFRGLHGAVGVERNSLSAALWPTLQEALPEVALRQIDGWVDELRAVKSPEEIEKLRRALALCDQAQADAANYAVKPGSTEIYVWASLKGAIEQKAGCRVPVLADLVAGERTAEIGGLPGGTVLREGDPVIVDIVPRLDGYWGDNAGTHFAGEPSPELKKIYATVLATLRRGIEAVKPGAIACELDGMLREAIRSAGYPVYPHHSGHGIGTTYHEEPRIVPYNRTALAPGMVVALEPGIYIPGVGGVRLEDVVLVMDYGCEVLTKHLGN